MAKTADNSQKRVHVETITLLAAQFRIVMEITFHDWKTSFDPRWNKVATINVWKDKPSYTFYQHLNLHPQYQTRGGTFFLLFFFFFFTFRTFLSFTDSRIYCTTDLDSSCALRSSSTSCSAALVVDRVWRSLVGVWMNWLRASKTNSGVCKISPPLNIFHLVEIVLTWRVSG